MSYEDLTLNGFLKEIKEVSDGPHPRKFCFVLGAGASKSSGIKSGQELVNIWEKDLLERNEKGHLEWKNKLGINDENKYEFYSQYYERRFRNIDDGYNYLEKLMESAKPSIGYVILSYIMTHTPHNIVITTNFDHLIEDAVNYYQNTIPLVIGHESLAHYVTKQINRPMIIKIHRDLLLDPKNRALELDALHDNWKEALRVVFSEYYPIFIGYAGNDRSLMDYLDKNSDIFSDKKGNFPYWMLYEDDKISGDVSKFLNASNGYLIKHNGFDKVLLRLGDMFGYRLPSEDAFISDAKIRYKKLSDAMDALIDDTSIDKKIMQEANDVVSDKANETLEDDQTIQRVTSQAETQNLFGKAVGLVNEGKYQEAMEIFRDLIKREDQNARYYAWLGAALYKMKHYEEALKEMQRASELEPDDASYHNGLGATLHSLGRYEEALEEMRRASNLDPENEEYQA
ncbi:MAG: tetratricopeptide repeat protein, partial [Lachnospiraceae bacterium]|nr:tetratricopeptide repeat protein [Lachnospiraceae bacterium]